MSKSKTIRIITVGKPHSVFWKEAADHYIKKLSHWCAIEEIVVKDGSSSLPVAQRVNDECRRISAAMDPCDIAICLDERGDSLTSAAFAAFLESTLDNASFRPCFIIGGPFGLNKSLREQARCCISFGSQTVTHEMAKVLLVEQLYRAETILHNVPYHHA